jgi:uncharacterized alpha-E superfamily protein
VAFNLQALQGCAQALRERLSPEHWQLIREVGEQFQGRLSAIFESASTDPITEVIDALTQADGHLAAITGGQTDRMTRDDGWRLLSVGRQIERLDFLAHAMACSFEHGLHRCDDGFALMLGLFDSTITYRAHFQARREVPRCCTCWCSTPTTPFPGLGGRTMRERLLKLARHEPAWAQEVVEKLPRPEQWSLDA